MKNASTAAIERSCAKRPHAGIGPWNAALPTPMPITVTPYTADSMRVPARPASARPSSSTPASTYARLDRVLAGCESRPWPMRSQSEPPTPVRRSLLLWRVDADAVREREAAAHDLGWLRLAVDESDSAHRALRPGADAIAGDRDPDVGEVQRAVGADAEPERRPRREGALTEALVGWRLEHCSHVATIRVVLVDHAADHAGDVEVVLRRAHDRDGGGEPVPEADELLLLHRRRHRRSGGVLLLQPPLAVSEVGNGPEYRNTPAVGGRADGTYTRFFEST